MLVLYFFQTYKNMSSIQKSVQIYVGKLPTNIRKKELMQIFGKYGKLLSCIIKSAKNIAFAFIEFAERQDAQNAINCEHQTYIHDKEIVVEWSKTLKPILRGRRPSRRPLNKECVGSHENSKGIPDINVSDLRERLDLSVQNEDERRGGKRRRDASEERGPSPVNKRIKRTIIKRVPKVVDELDMVIEQLKALTIKEYSNPDEINLD